jgi:integrase
MTQLGTITERPRADGEMSYLIKWRENGKQKTETIRGTEADAKRRLRMVIDDLTAFIAPPMTLAEWSADYRVTNVVGKRPATVARYRQHMGRVCQIYGATPLTDIEHDDVQRLYAGFIRDGLTVRTANAVISTLYRVLAKAVRSGHIEKNPAEGVEKGTPVDNPPDVLTADGLKAFIDDLKGDNGGTSPERRFMLQIVILAAMTGMRRGEIIGLTWADFDRANDTVRITGAKTPAGNRKIKLDPETAAMMREHQRDQAVADPAARVFPGIRENLLSTRFGALARRYGLPNGFRFHTLRHTHATLLLSSGVPVAAVSKRLGHKHPGITYKTYAHALDQDDDAAVNVMAGVLGG